MEYTFEDLVRLGVYEISGMDEDGEFNYTLNTIQARLIAPEIYNAHVAMAEVEALVAQAMEDEALIFDAEEIA